VKTALIADIRRLTVHDGPGTRDTVFVKGCPLHCLWCHNPESISVHPQLLFRPRLCTGCGGCAEVCPNSIHSLEEGKHTLARENCTACGACAESCLPGALVLCGKLMSAEEVLTSVLRDKAFFLNSGGGVTVSGGEPLLYPEFTAELFRLLKAENIHTALDTCGAVPYSAFGAVLPYTDRILYDIKGMDSGRHRRNTGRGNEEILENLRRLGSLDIPIEIRMPVVPGCNDDLAEIRAAGAFLKNIRSVCLIRLLAYHSMAKEKYAMCGRTDTMPAVEPPSADTLRAMAEILQQESGIRCSVFGTAVRSAGGAVGAESVIYG